MIAISPNPITYCDKIGKVKLLHVGNPLPLLARARLPAEAEAVLHQHESSHDQDWALAWEMPGAKRCDRRFSKAR